eukprot:TRINITY_DN50578_c0_g1_i1.p3 TRINITY_DN50578_c0_g1~~TRINITY_DN50578_c0_g1_i1.p3  ORF type:complete len:140 (-),score=37.34 TRINITY_DN50578_c0_g1_i1:23-442(-)
MRSPCTLYQRRVHGDRIEELLEELKQNKELIQELQISLNGNVESLSHKIQFNEEEEQLMKKNMDLRSEIEAIQRQYYDSKLAWDSENASVKTEIAEKEALFVSQKYQFATLATEVDSLKILYSQKCHELQKKILSKKRK